MNNRPGFCFLLKGFVFDEFKVLRRSKERLVTTIVIKHTRAVQISNNALTILGYVFWPKLLLLSRDGRCCWPKYLT